MAMNPNARVAQLIVTLTPAERAKWHEAARQRRKQLAPEIRKAVRKHFGFSVFDPEPESDTAA